jgi:hypothetical protein
MPTSPATTSAASKPATEQQEIYVAIWSKAVDTQMHFNEMSVKSRQFGLTFVAAALGLGIALLGRGEEFSISLPYWGGFDLHVAVLIVFSGALALGAVRVLDLNVYHKMLRGAVTFNEDFEQNYMKEIFDLEKGMTQAISHFSRHKDAKVDKSGEKYHYEGTDKKDAFKKIRQFYNLSIGTILAAAFGLFMLTAHFGHPSHPIPNGSSLTSKADENRASLPTCVPNFSCPKALQNRKP